MSRHTRRRRTLAAAMSLAACAAAMPAAAHANVQVGTSGWEWGNPLPQGNTLTDESFSGGVGYAAGSFGTLLKTTDGGATWTGLPTGTFADLYKVQAVDANTVIAAGACTARLSTDGGATFTPVNFNRDCLQDLAGVSFVAPTAGYFVLADGSVFTTVDGGQSFTPTLKSIPGTTSVGGSDTATALTFVNLNRGFAATSGGMMYATNDGGATWSPLYNAGQALNEILFTSATRAYAVGNAGTFLRSDDGGQTWTPYSIGATDHDFTHVGCATDDLCVVSTKAGDIIIKVESVFPPAPATTTTTTPPDNTTTTTTTTPPPTGPTGDTGATGTTAVARSVRIHRRAHLRDATPAPSTGVNGTTIFPSTDPIYAAGFASPTQIVATGANGTTVVSADAGATFTPVGGRLSGTFTSIVAGAAPGTVYAPGKGGFIAKSIDGGKTFTTASLASTSDVVGVSFPSASVGVALNEAGTPYVTTNGGSSYASKNAGTPSPASLVYAPDQNTILLGGRFGVAQSTDRGDTFAIVKAKALKKFRPDAFNPAGSSVFAYSSQQIVESSDGGTNWKAVLKPGVYKTKLVKGKKVKVNGLRLSQVDFVDAGHGFARDESGKVYKTVNGGKKWVELPSVGTSDTYGMSFSSPTSGYLILDGFGDSAKDQEGYLLRTTDGGATFHPQFVISQQIVDDGVSAQKGGTDYLLGGDSALLASTTGGDQATAKASSLSIDTDATKLKKPAKVAITGQLTPATGNETVVLSSRAPGRADWSSKTMQVASNGKFTFSNLKVSKGANLFVAQFQGAQGVKGAGTKTLTVTVGKVKKRK